MYDNPLNAPPSRPAPEHAPTTAPSFEPANFYAPPVADYDPMPTFEDEGNYGLGFAVGFVFSLLGLIIVMVAGKSGTKRGALHGFLGRLGLGLVLLIITGVFL
jgi:hypothetical protein